jgi:ubiquinone/menaquinone biosynthesis C-methylase UbiE
MEHQKSIYGEKLSKEWVEYVEASNPKGTRETEIFPFIRRWIENIKPSVLLDIGCGQGICSNLISNDVHYIGIDPSKHLIKRARQIYSSKNKEYKIGNAYSLPIKDNSIDAVLSVWVWSHLESLENASQEISRVLKPNGKYLIITANPETYEIRKTFYKKYQLKDNLLKGDFDLGNGKVLTNSSLYLHSLDEIKNALTHHNLSIDNESRMGQDTESPKGLYIVLSGTKLN